MVLPAVLAAPAWRRLPTRMRRRLGMLVDDRLEHEIDAHPETTQHAVDATGGLLDGLLGLPPWHLTVPEAAADVARLYPAEHAPVVRRRDDLVVPLAAVAPASLTALVRHLRQTNALSPPADPGDQGTIEIQTLHAPDGRPRYVVYLPGTDDPGTMPWSHGRDVRDLPADLRSEAGESTAYATGIERAMAEAGIGRHDPVLLVGHSLGGMEAASLLAHGTPFHVTNVVTAGSPIGTIHHYPAGTHVLSLENRGDVVPLLDGRDNADSVGQVTVQFDDPGSSVIGSHALRHYVRGAAAADASSDPSVRAQLASLRAHGFLGSGDRATSQVFQIVR
jgi:pimeloyl-ACP methyl ester carboxylesterase